MDVVETKREGVVVFLTEGELAILANAINEALESVEAWEFSTRVGVEPDVADKLRRQLGDALASLSGDRV
jgi:hypothetical protein